MIDRDVLKGPDNGVNCPNCGVRLPADYEHPCPDCGTSPTTAQEIEALTSAYRASQANLLENLAACRRNCYRLQEGGRRLVEALKEVAAICEPVKGIAEKALQHRPPDPDWRKVDLPDEAPHGWVFFGPDGRWHWSPTFDPHESVEDQRPATAVEKALGQPAPYPRVLCSDDHCNRNIAVEGECGLTCRNRNEVHL